MDKAIQLEDALRTGKQILVEFYADWSPHNEWVQSVVDGYKKQVGGVVQVNIGHDKALADSYNIETAPAFLLLLRGKELWRQVGEMTMEELKDVLDEFR